MTHYRIVKTKCTIKTGWTGNSFASEGLIDSDSIEASNRISEWLGYSLDKSNKMLFDYYKESLQ